jgi:ribosomal protein S12 methylthiotransferase
VLLGDLARAGFEITAEHEDADAIVVNTCAFVEDAKAESLEVCGAVASTASAWQAGTLNGS